MIFLSLWDYVRRLSTYWGQSRTVTAHFGFMIAVLFGWRVFGHISIEKYFFHAHSKFKTSLKMYNAMYVLGSVLNA